MGVRAKFEKAYEKRLRQAARLERQTVACLKHQCGSKIQHRHFWSAMNHAMQLTRDCQKLYMPYHCEDCGFAHVGHNEGSNSVVWMMDAFSVKVKYVGGVLEGV